MVEKDGRSDGMLANNDVISTHKNTARDRQARGLRPCINKDIDKDNGMNERMHVLTFCTPSDPSFWQFYRPSPSPSYLLSTWQFLHAFQHPPSSVVLL